MDKKSEQPKALTSFSQKAPKPIDTKEILRARKEKKANAEKPATAAK